MKTLTLHINRSVYYNYRIQCIVDKQNEIKLLQKHIVKQMDNFKPFRTPKVHKDEHSLIKVKIPLPDEVYKTYTIVVKAYSYTVEDDIANFIINFLKPELRRFKY